jgi:hypothetical protein
MDTKYPEINIPLVGEDGNAFSILGRVQRIMRQNNLAGEFTAFQSEATAGDYDQDEDDDEGDTCGWCDEAHSDCEC